MVSKDKTLNEVFNLDYGYSMERDFIGGEWTRAKIEKDDNGDEYPPLQPTKLLKFSSKKLSLSR